MVVGAFPAAKLGVLAFKQLSKPIANVIKERAKKSPFFRDYIAMPPAQFYNWVEVKTKMWALNLGKPTNVPQLNEAMAIELGANLLGEVIIFTIGAGLLIFEYVRQSNKEAKKEESILMEKKELVNTINDLALQLERQDAQLREINRVVAELDSRNWIPKKLKILPSRKDDSDDEPPLKLNKLPVPASPETDGSSKVKNVSATQSVTDKRASSRML
ncbi:putative OPA3-like protein CG13603 isoform X2 [Bradysia coprophila]|uniref:putative OPA3-like protein CG13603 isoform X2 n=1 Tax=Bradysia coprophila TaxID=38358 RepID=UPI00187DA50D|nr:putative OPA3-like protein CG13603 isoform X2 [Bradysia coprophila]